MPRNNRIRILRSETVGQNATDLTAGEPFINIAERRLVIGGTGNATPIGFRSERDSVWSVNGSTGAVSLPLATVQGGVSPAVTGVAMFDCNNFVVDEYGKVSIGFGDQCYQCPPGSCDWPAGSNTQWGGIGATFDEPSGRLLAFVLNLDGLTEAGEASRTQYIPILQSGKTKKITAEKFISDNSAVFTAKTNSGQLSISKDTGTNSVDFAIIMGAVAANDQGLVKGASAHQYITQNTVKSINGLTGDVGCIAVTCAAQSFSGLQTFLHGISGASADLGTARISGLNYPTGDGADGDFITTDGNGNLSWIDIKDAMGASATYFILRDEKGNTSQIDDGNIMTVTGGPGINVFKYANDSIAVQGVTATTSVLGIASYSPDQFLVTNGQVSSLSMGLVAARGNETLGSLALNLGQEIVITGGNGIITEILDTNSDLEPDQISVYAYDASSTQKGVASFNSSHFTVASGAVSLTSGLVYSVDGKTGNIGLPLATTGNTGVASFNPTHFTVSATGHVSLATPASSSGTKTYGMFSALDNHPPTTNYATFNSRAGVGVLEFDGLTNEAAVFVGFIPEAASYGSMEARIKWMSSRATTGDVLWGAKWDNMNSDIDVESWSAVSEATPTTTNGTSGVPNTTTIACTALDGLTQGDLYRLYIYRGATATTDTMSDDAQVIAVEIRGVS